MVAPEVQGIDLFKIANRSISGWVPSLKTGATIRQPFCSQLEERLLLWLEYHPLVANYARGDIDPEFATKYRLPIPKHAPFTIDYAFEDTPHHYLPDAVGTLTNGQPFIAEAGMEDDKRGDRNLAKAEAARRLARLQQGSFWIGTERTLTKRRSYNLVFLHARRKVFPAFADIAPALQEVWPWGEVASVEEVASRLSHQFPVDLVEATIWKVVGDSTAAGHLLVDLEQFTLDRKLPLALLPPDATPILPAPLPDTLEPVPARDVATVSSEPARLVPGPTFDASRLPSPQREQFHRNLRAVELVLAGATQTSVAESEGIPRSTLGRLVRRTRVLGQIACVPRGSYRRTSAMHPAFAECIRRLYLFPTRLTMTAIREHTEMQQVAARLSKETGTTVKLPSYDQVRREIHRLALQPDLVAMREGAKSIPRERESALSFALSIPAPALLTQVDEHTMDLYVVTPSGETVASRVHAAVLICVKTTAILGAVLALGPLKEEDYMRLVKVSLERKDHLVGMNGCEHSWPCYGKPAIIFHDRGKIFTSERARSVLVDRLGIITEQAPPYAPSAKGTVENLFRWMTERFEKRLPNASYGVHDAETAAQAGGMTLEALERCFYQAIVDDYQQAFDDTRRQRRCVLKEILDQPEPTWLQWRRRLDSMQPFCRIASHSSEEVREILATLEQVYQPLLPQLNLRQWTSSIYAWLTQPPLDPTRSGRVTMDNLMKLVIAALEWSYEAKAPDVQVKWLERAAELLVLRHDTLWIIDGEGPTIEISRSDTTEQESVPQTEAGEAPAKDAPKQQPPHHDELGETQRAVPSTNCSFSGPIKLEAARWLESKVEVVQCPTCGSVSKAKVKGQSVVISPHPPRKSREVAQCHPLDGAGNCMGTRPEKGAVSL